MNKPALLDYLLRFGIARNDKRIFSQQRKERIGSIGLRPFGKGQQPLVEARMPLLHFLSRTPAVHPHQRDNQAHCDRRAHTNKQNKAPENQTIRGEGEHHQRTDDDDGQKQRGAHHRGSTPGPREQPETTLQPVQVMSKPFEWIHANSF